MVWHALTGPQADLAATAGGRRSPAATATTSPRSAASSTSTTRGWAALAELVGPQRHRRVPARRGRAHPARLDRAAPRARHPVRRRRPRRATGDGEPRGRRAHGIRLARTWCALAAATEPGPFGPNSHLTGRWFGIRREGRLVAMAGERIRVEGYGEVSGVCVDPAVRGEGLGAVVTLAAAHGIQERGDRAMLHVRDGNDGAHRLYRRIGFEVRRPVTVAVLRPEW